ncbi:MAG: NAD(P)-dependent oxidoreductase [Candidatus Latescibacterota bacterium]|nr:NAD(P)-dependent oxidoreductase [Candidatus Latescibacterota bacterium]
MSSVRVLITGAAGRVGTILRSHWGGRYDLRLADVRPIDDLSSHEHAVTFDMTRRDDCVEVCRDIDIVVHLAADSGSEDFDDSLLPRNVVGPLYLLEGAVAAGCRRVILTSSIYAVRGYGPDRPIIPHQPVFPQALYGVTKCWSEALARDFSARLGISCIAVRLGNPGFDQAGDWDPDEPSYRISPREAAQLFGLCVDVEEVDFAIVHGSSRHRRMWLDIESTRQLLDFEPQDGTAFPRANP